MKIILGVVILAFLSASPLLAGAHGTGASLEKEVDGYVVDVGYSPEAMFAGSPVRFDFNAYTKSDLQDVPFTDLWVKIYENQKIGFAGGVPKARLGLTGITYAFPSEGEYTLAVRFQNGDQKITEAEFPVRVEPGVNAGSSTPKWLIPGAALLVGVAAGFLFAKLRRKVV